MDTAQAVEPTTKASRIMALAAEGHTTRVIAGIVYGLTDDDPQSVWDKRVAYVRVVANQRKERGRSEIDDRYLFSPLSSTTRRKRWRERYYGDEGFRRKSYAASLAYKKARYASDANYRRCLQEWQREHKRKKYATDPIWRAKELARQAMRRRTLKAEAFKQEAIAALQRLERVRPQL